MFVYNGLIFVVDLIYHKIFYIPFLTWLTLIGGVNWRSLRVRHDTQDYEVSIHELKELSGKVYLVEKMVV